MEAGEGGHSRQDGEEVPVPDWPQTACHLPHALMSEEGCAESGEDCEDQQEDGNRDFSGEVEDDEGTETILRELGKGPSVDAGLDEETDCIETVPIRPEDITIQDRQIMFLAGPQSQHQEALP